MRVVIQRVSRASVTIDEKVVGKINKGYMVLVGVTHEDDQATVDRIVKKMISLRIFEDENGKTNLSLQAVNGELLIVSQFTLYADTSHGNRPGFTNAAKPDHANALYEYFVEKCKEQVEVVQTGQFGADMAVELVNDGPFTIILE
ncbi:D-tyrosyl-tRNA(Tyr) deacylase [Lachnospiraceae bacterium TWA4]|nr:D-tyrosyl-tRNA(Tyr) deacylase [Lachnospiraceae bacterium TWA4]